MIGFDLSPSLFQSTSKIAVSHQAQIKKHPPEILAGVLKMLNLLGLR
jgi:hypothetical protein